MTVGITGIEYVAGKARRVPASFDEAKRLCDWADKKGILFSSVFGQWAYSHYCRLYPQTESRVDYSMLDIY